MTPEEYKKTVLPLLRKKWNSKCFCESAGFRKIVSFDFKDDLFIGPTALADSEILIREIIQKNFVMTKSPMHDGIEISNKLKCPQCGTRCVEYFENFDNNFNRTFVRFKNHKIKLSKIGYYLIGFYGLDKEANKWIRDFKKVDSIETYIQKIT